LAVTDIEFYWKTMIDRATGTKNQATGDWATAKTFSPEPWWEGKMERARQCNLNWGRAFAPARVLGRTGEILFYDTAMQLNRYRLMEVIDLGEYIIFDAKGLLHMTKDAGGGSFNNSIKEQECSCCKKPEATVPAPASKKRRDSAEACFFACGNCGKFCQKSKCARCKGVRYCSRECQGEDWQQHKKECKKYNADDEGKVTDGMMMFAGEWFEVDQALDVMPNSGKATSDAFEALTWQGKANVLAGRVKLDIPWDPTLPPACPGREWYGSGGSKRRCDGCNRQAKKKFMDTCTRCQYTICEDCCVHTARGTCFCKDRNFDMTYDPDPTKRGHYHHGRW
jgi:hypothetical protein